VGKKSDMSCCAVLCGGGVGVREATSPAVQQVVAGMNEGLLLECLFVLSLMLPALNMPHGDSARSC
jgi:hypothetical protein